MATNLRTENVIFLENKRREVFEKYNQLLANRAYYDNLLKQAKEIQTRMKKLTMSKSMRESLPQMQSLQAQLEGVQSKFNEAKTRDIEPIKKLKTEYYTELQNRYDPLEPDAKVISQMRFRSNTEFNKIDESFRTFDRTSNLIRDYNNSVQSFTITQTGYKEDLQRASRNIRRRYEIYRDGKFEVENYNDPKLEDITNTIIMDTPEGYLEALKKKAAEIRQNDKPLYDKIKDVLGNLIKKYERDIEFNREHPGISGSTGELKGRVSELNEKFDISELESLFQETPEMKSVKTVKKPTPTPKKTEPAPKKDAEPRKEDNTKEQSSFDEALKRYASFMQNYYADEKGTKGKAHSQEEHKQRRKINDMMKKYIDMEIKNSAKNDASVMTGQKDDKAVVDEISNAVNPKDIEELANSDGAALKLAQIMSSGIYVKDGQRIRLTRKQRVALSNALAQAVEKKMDLNSKGKNNNNNGKSGQVVAKEMGEE
ncbi:MAG: hypothetical protein IJX17_06455 [Clostridia bacterium]|nr:hypothetical protein [Clostridia bacterium]